LQAAHRCDAEDRSEERVFAKGFGKTRPKWLPADVNICENTANSLFLVGLAEPIGSRTQDDIILLDARVEKVFKFGGRSVSVFGDGFNLTNANPASNITWSSGSTFLLPVTIVSPRLARIGAKLDW